MPNDRIGQLIGNAMSLNVIERIIHNIINHTDPECKIRDRWKDGTAQQRLIVDAKNISPQNQTINRIQTTTHTPTLTKQIGLIAKMQRALLLDSGASHHMVQRSTLTEEEKQTIRNLVPPIEINTANGVILVTECCDIHIPTLNITVMAILLESTPDVLSMGRLNTINGWGTAWPPGGNAYLYNETSRVPCILGQNVPFLLRATTPETISSVQHLTDNLFPNDNNSSEEQSDDEQINTQPIPEQSDAAHIATNDQLEEQESTHEDTITNIKEETREYLEMIREMEAEKNKLEAQLADNQRIIDMYQQNQQQNEPDLMSESSYDINLESSEDPEATNSETDPSEQSEEPAQEMDSGSDEEAEFDAQGMPNVPVHAVETHRGLISHGSMEMSPL